MPVPRVGVRASALASTVDRGWPLSVTGTCSSGASSGSSTSVYWEGGSHRSPSVPRLYRAALTPDARLALGGRRQGTRFRDRAMTLWAAKVVVQRKRQGVSLPAFWTMESRNERGA